MQDEMPLLPDELVRELAQSACRDVYGPGQECDQLCEICMEEARALLELHWQ